MNLVIFGLNHRTAPLAIREKWAFSADEAKQALVGAQDLLSASENVILSTCNRTEIYSLFPGTSDNGSPDLSLLAATSEGVTPRGAAGGERRPPAAANCDPKCLNDLLDFFLEVKSFSRRDHLPHFYTHRQRDAVEHLFRVAAGLDSMIQGEGQILRQLRDAYELAQQAGSVGKVFLRLFPAALKAGKRTRAETGISQGCLTHGHAALKIACETVGELKGKQLVLVGSGKVGRLAAQALHQESDRRVAVVSRSLERAQKMAEPLAGEAFSMEELPRLLEAADVVISSSGARKPLVRTDLLHSVLRKRAGRPLCIIDLAVPRDFDPACSEIPGVSLFNIDHLNSVVEGNVRERSGEIGRAEGIVQEELRTFFGQMNWIHLDPVIRHMVERFEAIRVAEVERYIERIPPEARADVEALTSALLKKILHFPIEKLKSLRDGAGLSSVEINFLRRLFLTPTSSHGGPLTGAPPGAPPTEAQSLDAQHSPAQVHTDRQPG